MDVDWLVEVELVENEVEVDEVEKLVDVELVEVEWLVEVELVDRLVDVELVEALVLVDREVEVELEVEVVVAPNVSNSTPMLRKVNDPLDPPVTTFVCTKSPDTTVALLVVSINWPVADEPIETANEVVAALVMKLQVEEAFKELTVTLICSAYTFALCSINIARLTVVATCCIKNPPTGS